MIKKYFPLSLLLLFILLFGSVLRSQNKNEKAFTINNKIAIIRLYMNGPKITYLTKQLSNSALSVKDRQSIQEHLDLHLLDRKIYSQNMISDFDKYFNANETFFVPDNLWASFLETKNKNGLYFLNNKAEIDASIKLPENKSYYVIGRVNDDYDFQIYDEEGFKVPSPYPSTTKHSFISKLKSIFGDEGKVSVSRFNEKILNWEKKNAKK